MTDTRQFSTFVVDGLLFGIDVTRVQEVIRWQELTPVPLAPDVVRGLINLRGQIVTALDLRVRLELSPKTDDAPQLNVVVRTDEGAVALLVDEIGDVITVGQDCWEHAPATLPASVRGVIPGAYKLDHRLLLPLDVDATLAVATA